jgi:hypothetical protein
MRSRRDAVVRFSAAAMKRRSSGPVRAALVAVRRAGERLAHVAKMDRHSGGGSAGRDRHLLGSDAGARRAGGSRFDRGSRCLGHRHDCLWYSLVTPPERGSLPDSGVSGRPLQRSRMGPSSSGSAERSADKSGRCPGHERCWTAGHQQKRIPRSFPRRPSADARRAAEVCLGGRTSAAGHVAEFKPYTALAGDADVAGQRMTGEAGRAYTTKEL